MVQLKIEEWKNIKGLEMICPSYFLVLIVLMSLTFILMFLWIISNDTFQVILLELINKNS